LLLLLISPALHADGTLRFTINFKLGALIPPSALQQTSGKIPSIAAVVRVKGDKQYSEAADRKMIYDFATQQITIIDQASKRYCTVNMNDYMSQLTSAMPPSTVAIPPQAKPILQSMKVTFTSRKTGRTDSVFGVPVTESEWVLTVEMPAASLPLPGLATSPSGIITISKIVAHAWIASADDVARNPALKEVMAHRSSTVTSLYNPDTLLKSIADFPGIHDTVASMLGRYASNPPMTLKLDAEVFLPVLAQVAPLAAAAGKPLPPGFDPNASLGELDVATEEISGATIDPAIFEVPSGFTSTSLQDLLKLAAPKAPVAPVAPAAPAVPPNQAFR
jgi:hypothetical protein